MIAKAVGIDFVNVADIKTTSKNHGRNKEHRPHGGSCRQGDREQPAKLPSDIFLWSSIASMGVSLGLKIAGYVCIR